MKKSFTWARASVFKAEPHYVKNACTPGRKTNSYSAIHVLANLWRDGRKALASNPVERQMGPTGWIGGRAVRKALCCDARLQTRYSRREWHSFFAHRLAGRWHPRGG